MHLSLKKNDFLVLKNFDYRFASYFDEQVCIYHKKQVYKKYTATNCLILLEKLFENDRYSSWICFCGGKIFNYKIAQEDFAYFSVEVFRND